MFSENVQNKAVHLKEKVLSGIQNSLESKIQVQRMFKESGQSLACKLLFERDTNPIAQAGRSIVSN